MKSIYLHQGDGFKVIRSEILKIKRHDRRYCAKWDKPTAQKYRYYHAPPK